MFILRCLPTFLVLSRWFLHEFLEAIIPTLLIVTDTHYFEEFTELPFLFLDVLSILLLLSFILLVLWAILLLVRHSKSTGSLGVPGPWSWKIWVILLLSKVDVDFACVDEGTFEVIVGSFGVFFILVPHETKLP